MTNKEFVPLLFLFKFNTLQRVEVVESNLYGVLREMSSSGNVIASFKTFRSK